MAEKKTIKTSGSPAVNLSVLDHVGGCLEGLSVNDGQSAECQGETSTGAVKKKIPVGVWRSKKSSKRTTTGTSSSEKNDGTRLVSVNGRPPNQKSGSASEKKQRQKLSISDPTCEKAHLQRGFNSLQFRNDFCSMHPSSSSTSSHSSGNFRSHRERRSSDSRRDGVSLVPYGLRAHHAAHRCAWSESDSGSATSPGYVSMRRSADELLDIRENSTVLSYPSTPTESKRAGGRPILGRQFSRPGKRETRFEMYMPLCEVQQGLKKGEVIEGILRINPRNYEDAYISAPDGQMDIYVGGTHDRNRALNGDVVAVQLNPPEDWKVLWDAIRDYEEIKNRLLFGNVREPATDCQTKKEVAFGNDGIRNDPRPDALRSSEWTNPQGDDVLDIGHWQPDSIEILGMENFSRHLAAFHQEQEQNSGTTATRSKKKKKKNKSKNSQTMARQVLLSDASVKSDGKSVDCNTWITSNTTVQDKTDVKISDYANNSASLIDISVPSQENVVRLDNTSSVIHGYSSPPASNCTAVESQKDDNCTLSHGKLPFVLCSPKTKPTMTSIHDKSIVEDIDDKGLGSLIVSPEELLDFDATGHLSSDEYSERDSSECVGVTVALEDLSEEEYTESVSGESTCSRHLDQLQEDTSFLACQQDCANNNVSEPYFRTVNDDAFVSMPETSSRVNDNSNNSDGAVVSQVSGTGAPSSPPCVVANSDPSYHMIENNESCIKSSFQPSAINSSTVPEEHAECNDQSPMLDALLLDNEHCSSSAFPVPMPRGTLSYDVTSPSPDALPALATDVACDEDQGKDAPDLQGKKVRKRQQKRNRKKKDKAAANADANTAATTAAAIRDVEGSEAEAMTCDGPATCRIDNSCKSSKKANHKNTLPVTEIMKHPHWQKFVQKTGKVVHILEAKNTRIACGHLRLMQDKNPNWAFFSPNDHRMPRMMIPMSECPQGFYERPQDFERCLFICKLVKWDQTSTFPRGSLLKNLGDSGDVDVESEAMLIEYGIDFSEFPEEAIKSLPFDEEGAFSLSELDLKRAFRRDFREECVFTIDPATARDLDDALSCRKRDDGLYEVGVHIADVTYFLQEGTLLDQIAADRATSVYLVQRVIPMLPRILCEKLCSLNPGEDRLTLSVVWIMDDEARIVDSWCGRSVIRSCVKLSYEHAQDMIENPTRRWSDSEHPPIYGSYGIDDIAQRVLRLHDLAVQLRKRRFDEGALRLDQIKLQFTLNKETGLPSGFSVYEQRDSHRLVEEFMLLANMHVAHAIYEAFPSKAMLRLHPPPQLKLMEDVVTMCATLGIHLDASTAGTLQASLAHYIGLDEFSQARTLVLTALCAKPMNRALYFCAGCIDDPLLYRHYALNIPLYTHFTSPIRRYPDVIVHRMLLATLGIGSEPKSSPNELHKLASHCNDKKYVAKQISELSSELFLGAFVKECGPLEEVAMVMGVLDHSFDVLLLRLGVVKRVYTDNLPLKKIDFKKQRGVPQIILHWDDGTKQLISIFSLVNVVVSASTPDEPLKFNAVLRHPA